MSKGISASPAVGIRAGATFGARGGSAPRASIGGIEMGSRGGTSSFSSRGLAESRHAITVSTPKLTPSLGRESHMKINISREGIKGANTLGARPEVKVAGKAPIDLGIRVTKPETPKPPIKNAPTFLSPRSDFRVAGAERHALKGNNMITLWEAPKTKPVGSKAKEKITINLPKVEKNPLITINRAPQVRVQPVSKNESPTRITPIDTQVIRQKDRKAQETRPVLSEKSQEVRTPLNQEIQDREQIMRKARERRNRRMMRREARRRNKREIAAPNLTRPSQEVARTISSPQTRRVERTSRVPSEYRGRTFDARNRERIMNRRVTLGEQNKERLRETVPTVKPAEQPRAIDTTPRKEVQGRLRQNTKRSERRLGRYVPTPADRQKLADVRAQLQKIISSTPQRREAVRQAPTPVRVTHPERRHSRRVETWARAFHRKRNQKMETPKNGNVLRNHQREALQRAVQNEVSLVNTQAQARIATRPEVIENVQPEILPQVFKKTVIVEESAPLYAQKSAETIVKSADKIVQLKIAVGIPAERAQAETEAHLGTALNRVGLREQVRIVDAREQIEAQAGIQTKPSQDRRTQAESFPERRMEEGVNGVRRDGNLPSFRFVRDEHANFAREKKVEEIASELFRHAQEERRVVTGEEIARHLPQDPTPDEEASQILKDQYGRKVDPKLNDGGRSRFYKAFQKIFRVLSPKDANKKAKELNDKYSAVKIGGESSQEMTATREQVDYATEDITPQAVSV